LSDDGTIKKLKIFSLLNSWRCIVLSYSTARRETLVPLKINVLRMDVVRRLRGLLERKCERRLTRD